MSALNFLNYNEVVKKLSDHLQTTNPSSLSGQELIELYRNKLQTSAIPLHDVRAFIIDAKVYPDDLELQRCAGYCKNILKNNQKLNFHLGLAREEHFAQQLQYNMTPEVEIEPYKFDLPEIQLRDAIATGEFDSLQSAHLNTIKERLNLQSGVEPTVDENSYQAVLMRIYDLLGKYSVAEGGNNRILEMINNQYSSLMESTTPLSDIKEFVTNAQNISGSDATMKEIINFCKKAVSSNDLNFLINLAKEEHFGNLNRAGHPNPQETIKTIDKYFALPSTDIAKKIREGVFDNLESKILNEVKVSLGYEVAPPLKSGKLISTDKKSLDKKSLNESFAAQLQAENKVMYNPVGFHAGNGTFMVEQDVLRYDPATEEFDVVDDFEPTPTQQIMLDAIQNVEYDPETEQFSLDESFDLNVVLDTKTNQLLLEGQAIDIDELKRELYESMQNQLVHGKIGYVHKPAMFKSADRFIMLCENSNHLVKFNNLQVIRDLSESNTYVMYQHKTLFEAGVPKLLSGGGMLFESFTDMAKSFDVLKPLLESAILNESQQIENQQKVLNEALEEQKVLNAEILKYQNVIGVAEPGSPAQITSQQKLEELQEQLEQNIKEVADLQQ